LAQIRARIAEGEPVSAAAASVAHEDALPAPPLLAAARSHADLLAPVAATRVCRGTSCELRGAPRVAAALSHLDALRAAHCLGYCHRSPVVLAANGSVHVGADPGRIAFDLGRSAPLPSAPRVDCLAPEPIVTRRIGRGDFSQLSKARAAGAYGTLERALALGPEAVLREVESSGERGRGGGSFPTAAKWRAAAAASGAAKVVVANGDEGDPGAYIDRVLLERDPHGVLEGLALCALAVGAELGVVFVRSEYPRAVRRMREAVAEAERAGLLGARLASGGPPFQVHVVEGFGSYVCGEETALLATLEGGRGEVRPRPPFPTEHGLFGRPTVVNNVETLVNVPWIVERGGAAFAALGTAHSHGTKVLCLNAGFANPGIVEVPFGLSLRDVIEDWGATPCRPDELAGVLVGGPMGSFVAPEACDVALCWEALRERGIRLGHGGLVAVPRDADLAAVAEALLRFAAAESCGRCTPCRDGSQRALALTRAGARENAEALRAVLGLMRSASLCPFGRDAPGPIEALLTRAAARGAA
jgi:NADH:ubiquinone oxidoreductase subunit F (NADH-binding)